MHPYHGASVVHVVKIAMRMRTKIYTRCNTGKWPAGLKS